MMRIFSGSVRREIYRHATERMESFVSAGNFRRGVLAARAGCSHSG